MCIRDRLYFIEGIESEVGKSVALFKIAFSAKMCIRDRVNSAQAEYRLPSQNKHLLSYCANDLNAHARK